MRITQPVSEMRDGKLAITCQIAGAPSLYAILDGPADVLARVEPRIEPFLPIAVLMAGAARRDLVIEGPVDLDFVAVLRLRFVPLLQMVFGFGSVGVNIIQATRGRARLPGLPRKRNGPTGPAALLFSGGIDSFYSLTRLRSVGYPLRLLVNVNAGAHCHRACMERRVEQIRRVAGEAGLEGLVIDTNFQDVVDLGHLVAHPFRTLAAAYTAHRAIRAVFLSTAQAYPDLSFDWMKGGFEALGGASTDSVAWPRMPVIEIGYEKRRFEKLEAISDDPLSYHALDVCWSGEHPPGGYPGTAPNCGRCVKCARAILSLDLMGRLDRYRSQFELAHYPSERDELIRICRRHDSRTDRDLLARLDGWSLPGSSVMPVAAPSWASPQASPGEQNDARTSTTPRLTAPVRLHWWRGQHWKDRGLVANVGDELSPLLVERITGRKVEWASLEACDLVAIGSLVEAAVRANRSRPVHLWGTGFIGDGPTLHHAQVEVAALRGPLTAARLGLQDCVPLGDPGLLAGLVFDRRPEKTRAIGIVPHHLECDLPIIESWQTGSDAVISPELPPKEFMEAIAGCELVLSSSLHGLIIADALGVPNVWVKLSERVTGHGFKYRDYLGGLGRSQEPRGLPLPDLMDERLIDDLASSYELVDVAGIGQRLVDAFPDV